jgi:hypothetical protein
MLGYEFTPANGGKKEGFSIVSKTGDLENLDFNRTQPELDEIQKIHVKDFLAARETRSRPVADVEEGHISTACCILANLAQDLGRPVRYDPATRTVVGDPEATKRLIRDYRSPWTHPTHANV